jgi:hypothetical protein
LANGTVTLCVPAYNPHLNEVYNAYRYFISERLSLTYASCNANRTISRTITAIARR